MRGPPLSIPDARFDKNVSDPIIRIWGGHRESDWNEYWTMDGVLRQRRELAAAVQGYGVKRIDICGALRPPAPVPKHQLEVFITSANPADHQKICNQIQDLLGLVVKQIPGDSDTALREIVDQRLLYLRQGFEMWDELLPRLIFGVDFDAGKNRSFRPAEPEKWRVFDHVVDGTFCARRVLTGRPLEASDKGRSLLADLTKEFGSWNHGAGFRGRPTLNAILDYRRVLQRYDVDCNESFADRLAEGWHPVDIEEERDWHAARELCATPLPENPGDLVVDENNRAAQKYSANLQFIALTQNSD